MRIKRISLIIFTLFILVSCKPKDIEVIEKEKTTVENIIEEEKEIINEEEEDKDNSNKNNTTELEIVENEDKTVSKLDGLYYSDEVINKRPIAIMYDNHPNSRWQAGISEAEIVYECEVEYPYTRYLAIFQSGTPEQVGSVRSARPYFIYYALEYDPIYVHVGGSNDAMQLIDDLYVADVDGLYSGAFWRYYETGKEIPNNMYTNLSKIRNSAKYRGYRDNGNYNGYSFNESSEFLSEKYKNVEDTNYIKIRYNKENITEYFYDEEEEIYSRKKDGEIHIDENDDKLVTSKNILILEVTKKVLDNEGRLFLGVIGSGDGYYITNGQMIKIKWQKENEKARTVFTDLNGEEIKLNPGKTWIQVLSEKCELTMEEE